VSVLALTLGLLLLGMWCPRDDKPLLEPFKPKKKANFYRTAAWRRIRYRVIKQYGAVCMACGSEEKPIHVDHILPRSLFPDMALDFSNLQILCEACNMAKSNTDTTDWRPNGE